MNLKWIIKIGNQLIMPDKSCGYKNELYVCGWTGAEFEIKRDKQLRNE